MSLYYATRKVPFWSAIITQTHGSVSVPANATVYVDVQPPSNETWLVDFLFGMDWGGTYTHYVGYWDYNGAVRSMHARSRTHYISGAGLPALVPICVNRILTNSLYGSLEFYCGTATTGYYGYSGFKLSKPLWAPKPVDDPEVWKKAKTTSLPSALSVLDKYAWDIYGLDPSKPNDYALGVILEEDTPLAVDPATNFPVERYTAVVKADVLADLIAKFKAKTANPVATGYVKYLNKWKLEGIDLGIEL
jgi:hypothetical protein